MSGSRVLTIICSQEPIQIVAGWRAVRCPESCLLELGQYRRLAKQALTRNIGSYFLASSSA